jgi:acyl dehydratase
MEQLWFEDVTPGLVIPSRTFGPLSIVDTVQWAGFQENWYRLHWDREFARERSGLRSFIASGAYREALLVRAITDWIGPRGVLRKLTVRQSYPTFEGDLIQYSGTVLESPPTAEPSSILCDLRGGNQEQQLILTARCTLVLPSRNQLPNR